MKDPYVEISRRLLRLEKRVLFSSSIIARMASWFGTKKRNAVSRTLSGPEVIAFRASMEAHGMADDDDDDDESRDEKEEKAQRAP